MFRLKSAACCLVELPTCTRSEILKVEVLGTIEATSPWLHRHTTMIMDKADDESICAGPLEDILAKNHVFEDYHTIVRFMLPDPSIAEEPPHDIGNSSKICGKRNPRDRTV